MKQTFTEINLEKYENLFVKLERETIPYQRILNKAE